MFDRGLVSVSFRSIDPKRIMELCNGAGLTFIEWGSDVHAVCTDIDRLEYISSEQEKYGIRSSSYGTYFKIGRDRVECLNEYITAAKKLGCSILRIWCGEKNYTDMTEEERTLIISECTAAAKIAEESGVVLCCECHGGTFTNVPCGALRLMREVDSAHFLMYWQPNQHESTEYNLDYARSIAPYTKVIHVFNWKGNKKLPLSDAVEEWKRYLSVFDGSQKLLLEFMPDGSPDSLFAEAESLGRIVSEVCCE